jgi:hypothetical protein
MISKKSYRSVSKIVADSDDNKINQCVIVGTDPTGKRKRETIKDPRLVLKGISHE